MNEAADLRSAEGNPGRLPPESSFRETAPSGDGGACRPVRPGLIRSAGLAAAIAFLVLVGRFWHPVYGFTAFLQLDASNDQVKIAAFKRFPVYVYRDTGGYDGLYYAQIAYHPLLNAAELHPAMDNFSYRARRILAPALAWLLSAGRPALIVQVYSVLNVIAWLGLAWLLWRLLAVADGRGLLAWIGVLFSAGVLASVRFALTDLVALTALAGAMAAVERSRPGWAIAWFAAAALGRETSVVGLPGLLEPPWISRGNLRRAALATAPFFLWLLYVRCRTAWDDQPWGNFTLPLSGFFEKWRASVAAVLVSREPLLDWTTLLALAGLTAQALYFFKPRPAELWWRIGAAYVVIMLFFGTAVWEGFPGAALRVMLPLTLAFSILVCRKRSPLPWLLAGTLTVPAGLLALRDVPGDSHEIAAARGRGIAAVIHTDQGWFGQEHTRRHVWSWSGGRGRLEIETWPRAAENLRLGFSLRSLGSRTVTVRQNGRECWRGEVGRALIRVEIPVAISGGRGELEFATGAPGVREGPNPDARSLAFAIYDPRIGF